MLTIEDYAKQPREQRTQRLTRTADDLSAAIKGQSDAALSRPLGPRSASTSPTTPAKRWPRLVSGGPRRWRHSAS